MSVGLTEAMVDIIGSLPYIDNFDNTVKASNKVIHLPLEKDMSLSFQVTYFSKVLYIDRRVVKDIMAFLEAEDCIFKATVEWDCCYNKMKFTGMSKKKTAERVLYVCRRPFHGRNDSSYYALRRSQFLADLRKAFQEWYPKNKSSHDDEDDDDDKICYVCFDETRGFKTPCDHDICYTCFQKSVVRSSFTCGMCRRQTNLK